MTANAAAQARPERPALDQRAAEVFAQALKIATRDSGLRRRADMDPEDVAQHVAFEYFRLRAEPPYLKAWAATATRSRLIDLARQRQVLPTKGDVLLRLMRRRMGPSAGVIAGIQFLSVCATLSAAELELITEHLAGASNQQIAQAHGYASTAVAAQMISRIKRKLCAKFPAIRFDLEPQRIY